jgi:deoxyxylulose-5-phosphate synthase
VKVTTAAATDASAKQDNSTSAQSSDTISASIEHQGRIQTITAAMPHPNSFGGFHLQHTGSAGESATLIASIEMK